MNAVKVVSIKRTGALVFLVLLAAATVAPYTGNQFITGTIVNGVLLTATAVLGIRAGLAAGIIPSTIALATGLLPPVLAPMFPFIILGNALLVIVFDYLKQFNYWLGAISGAILKFGLLYGTVSIVTGLIIDDTAAANMSYMMSWPQLVTAIAGSLAALGVIRLKNRVTLH